MHCIKQHRSFDDLIGDQQQVTRDLEIERSGRLEIDDQVIFGRLLGGKISRSCTFQNLADLDGRTLEPINPDGTIRH